MKYNFDYKLNSDLNIKIMKLGLIFNKKDIEVLGRPKKVNIGLDLNNKALGIRAAKDKVFKEYPFVIKGNEVWLRVNCSKLVKEIETKGIEEIK